MGAKDLPAVVKHILAVTKQEKLSYVGYSLGCTIFFIAMIEHPELNDAVESMFALAPASNLASIGGLLGFLGRLPVNQFLSNQRSQQREPFLSNESKLIRSLSRYVCQTSFIGTVICRSYIFSIFGNNAKSFNMVGCDRYNRERIKWCICVLPVEYISDKWTFPSWRVRQNNSSVLSESPFR